MNLPKKQKGLSGMGWLFVLLLVGGAFTTGMKLAPYYFDFNTVKAILTDMEGEVGLVNKRTVDLKALIVKRLKLNNIREFKLDERLVIKRAPDRILINLDYEIRQPLISNVELLLSFKHDIQLRD